MRVLKYIFYIIFLAVLVAFCIKNSAKISLQIPFLEISNSLPAYIYLLIFFFFGVFFGYLFSLSDLFKAKRKAALNNKKNKETEQKLALYESELKIMENIRNSNLKLQQNTATKQILLQK